jgi:hypothetical protein
MSALKRTFVEERTLTALPIGLYQTAGWLLLVFSGLGDLGLSWDIFWHVAVGRDDLWIPPHILILSNLALSGVLCLGLVLWETWRFRAATGRSESTADADTNLDQVTVFGVFRAPLGVVLAGFGTLTGALAVPLDNYWHTMHGIDVGVWAPFHVMGFLGALIHDLGNLYLWGDLLRVARGAGGGDSGARPAVAGLMCTAMVLVFRVLWLTTPGVVRVPMVSLGPMPIMTYPVLLALLLPWVLVAIVRTIGARWSASTVGGLLLGYAILVALFVPRMIRTAVAAQGLSLRLPGPAAAKLGLYLLASMGTLASLVLLVGVLTDLLNLPRANRETRSPLARGVVTGLVLWLLGAALASTVQVAASAMRTGGYFSGGGVASIPAPASLTAICLALPAALVAGTLSGLVGDGLAQVWRRGPR